MYTEVGDLGKLWPTVHWVHVETSTFLQFVRYRHLVWVCTEKGENVWAEMLPFNNINFYYFFLCLHELHLQLSETPDSK